jgi:hypothetical protein
MAFDVRRPERRLVQSAQVALIAVVALVLFSTEGNNAAENHT